ncbi:MAG: glycoside hydrolase family 127 protein, partial [Bacillota bacterium]|nr:glycoside hydrolase family 127 protein [Bacillota bacterium]
MHLRKAGSACRLALRIPGWRRSYALAVNGRPVVRPALENGYVSIDCPDGKQEIELELTMQPMRVTCHPAVPENVGKVCLQRGPLVYCLEEADNGPELWRLLLPAGSSLVEAEDARWPGGIPDLQADGYRLADGRQAGLYSLDEKPEMEPARLTFIPYFAWSNRTPGEMLVWLRELATAPDAD